MDIISGLELAMDGLSHLTIPEKANFIQGFIAREDDMYLAFFLSDMNSAFMATWAQDSLCPCLVAKNDTEILKYSGRVVDDYPELIN